MGLNNRAFGKVGEGRMTRFEYRRLKVEQYDKHENSTKRRRGNNVDRAFYVREHGQKQVDLTDEDGDDYWAFRERAEGKFLEYLNRAGSEGWRVVYHNNSQQDGSFTWPIGTHLLERAVTI